MGPWGRGCLLQGFEWENFGVLNWQSLMGGGRTCRFDCIYVSYIISRQILIGHSFLKPFEKIGDKKLSRGEGGEFVSTHSLPAGTGGQSRVW